MQKNRVMFRSLKPKQVFTYGPFMYVKSSNKKKNNTLRMDENKETTFSPHTYVYPSDYASNKELEALKKKSIKPAPPEAIWVAPSYADITPKKPRLNIKSRFQVGDKIHEVFWNEDIGAHDVDKTATIRSIIIKITRDFDSQALKYTCEYLTVPGFDDMVIREDDDNVFKTYEEAAHEAKRRNQTANDVL